jgi:hypothetical protein
MVRIMKRRRIAIVDVLVPAFDPHRGLPRSGGPDFGRAGAHAPPYPSGTKRAGIQTWWFATTKIRSILSRRLSSRQKPTMR